jgi:hypothetical protein
MESNLIEIPALELQSIDVDFTRTTRKERDCCELSMEVAYAAARWRLNNAGPRKLLGRPS